MRQEGRRRHATRGDKDSALAHGVHALLSELDFGQEAGWL